MSKIIDVVDVLPDVHADFRDVLARAGFNAGPRLLVLDGQITPELVEALPDFAAWRDGDKEQVIIEFSGHTSALDADVDDSAALAVEVASWLTDLVMDALNTAWPQVRSDDGSLVVAEATIGEDGTPVWVAKGSTPVRFGQLRTTATA